MKRLASALIVAAAMAAAPAQATNLLANGSFEGEANGYDLLPGGSPAIGGWLTTNEGVEWFKPATYDPGNCCGPAHDGASIIDLAWFTSSGTPGGGISQSLSTVTGQTYRLSFWGINSTYAGRSGTGTVNIFAAGNALSDAVITRNAPTWALGDWRQFTRTFTATGATTLLEFQNHDNAFQNFALIDDVSVTAVPEPAAWALMIGGFAVAGAALRRRKTAARAHA